MRRAVGVRRLSVLTEETTSPERQKEIIAAKAASRDVEIVGWADDLDISASKHPPMDRPGLRAWLECPEDFDEVIFWRMDRFVRKPGDLAQMIDWSRQHHKGLVSATEAFDLEDPLGEAIAYIVAIFARMESAANSQRVTGSHEYLRRNGRWGGGHAPYGYMTAPNPEGKGWVLVIDTEAAEIVREAVARVIKGEAINAICMDFNRRDIPAPKDRAAQLYNQRHAGDQGFSARPMKGHAWGRTGLLRILRSPALLGYVVHGVRPVPDAEGVPIIRAEPVIGETRWDELQAALARRTVRKERTQTPSLLLGVAYCALCTRRLYRIESCYSGRKYVYYHCPQAAKAGEVRKHCQAMRVRGEELEEIAAAQFLGQVGDDTIPARVFEPGNDTAEQQAQVRRSLATARTEYDSGGYSYPGGQAEYDARVRGLSARLRQMAAEPVKEPGWRLVPTRHTFRERWATATVQERRKLMTDAGFVGAYARLRDGQVVQVWTVDPQLRERARAAAAGEHVIVPERRDVLEEVLEPARRTLRLPELTPPG
jgi:site-specific DNA recombinase